MILVCLSGEEKISSCRLRSVLNVRKTGLTGVRECHSVCSADLAVWWKHRMGAVFESGPRISRLHALQLWKVGGT